MKILVVKSDPYTQKIFQLILSREGHTILFSPTIKAGLLTAREAAPDLVLLDITFPDLDGVQFLAELRGAPETEVVPVIVLIEKSEADTKKNYVRAGASVCLIKPIHPHQLLAQIEALHL
jgi:DNA-binding response OmpR family regulator